ncbi:sulfotransferase domain-containing protein [uncultured Lamprocystis sp.]|uniref:sulfotransferase domain-containing protein n=1 Tax=uncultured Lamprocystis sp. TaxID=543132 RepID=UPI0025DE6D01|nr:sulfotransferase domain-containing protein [uncultured Lamprocystis sp.]
MTVSLDQTQLISDDGNQIVKRQLFVGIGVQKCATTWLYDILLDHPNVALSKRKELDFFSYHFGRGYQWYEEQFPADRHGCLVGEISPSYFVDANVPERLQAYAPEANLIVSLRDPVERAVSNHRHEVRLGNFHGDDLSFEAGLANNPLYLEQSRYGTYLQRWLRHIPVSRMLFLFQEDIDRDPQVIAQQVYRFLDVDDRHVSNAVEGRSNESVVHRSRMLEHARRSARDLGRLLGIDGVWRAAQKTGLQAVYRQLNRRPPEERIPPVSPETRQRLRLLLAEEIRLVEEITGRLLPHWRNQTSQ